MKIIVNGNEMIFNADVSISSVLENLSLNLKKIAVERNLEIVPKSAYDTTALVEGDKLEIVHFIGGG